MLAMKIERPGRADLVIYPRDRTGTYSNEDMRILMRLARTLDGKLGTIEVGRQNIFEIPALLYDDDDDDVPVRIEF